MIVVSKYLVLSKPLTWKLLYNSSYTKDYYKMNAFQHHFSADKIQLNFQASLLYIYVSEPYMPFFVFIFYTIVVIKTRGGSVFCSVCDKQILSSFNIMCIKIWSTAHAVPGKVNQIIILTKK